MWIGAWTAVLAALPGARRSPAPGLLHCGPAPPEEGSRLGTEEPPAGLGRGSRLSPAQAGSCRPSGALCQKYPQARRVLMNFLFSMLREEVSVGGLAAGSGQAGLEPPVSWLASGARSPLGSLCAGSANMPQSLWLQS